jgi:hypothetical protein
VVQVKAALFAIGLRPDSGLRTDQIVARSKAVRNPDLLALLGLEVGAAPKAVRIALGEQDGNGHLPIHHALLCKDPGVELVRAMLDAGGDTMLALSNNHKEQPLHYAAGNSTRAATVGLMLARADMPAPAGCITGASGQSMRRWIGADGLVRAKNKFGSTPLALAWEYNTGPEKAQIVALLQRTLGARVGSEEGRDRHAHSDYIARAVDL